MCSSHRQPAHVGQLLNLKSDQPPAGPSALPGWHSAAPSSGDLPASARGTAPLLHTVRDWVGRPAGAEGEVENVRPSAPQTSPGCLILCCGLLVVFVSLWFAYDQLLKELRSNSRFLTSGQSWTPLWWSLYKGKTLSLRGLPLSGKDALWSQKLPLCLGVRLCHAGTRSRGRAKTQGSELTPTSVLLLFSSVFFPLCFISD